MSTGAWNVFELFVVIETKINFSAEFVFAGDSRLESSRNQLNEAKSLVQSMRRCQCYREHSDSSHLLGMAPSVGELEASRADSCRASGEHRSLFSNFLVPTCARHDEFTFNLHSYRFLQSQRFEMRYIKSVRGAEMRRRRRLTLSGADPPPGKPDEASRPTLPPPDDESHQLRDNGESRALVAVGLNYTLGQLLILYFNLMVLLGFLVRLVVNSSRKRADLSALEARNMSGPGAVAANDISTKSAGFATDWQDYLTEVICSDLFANFTNGRMVNMVVAGSLVPSAVLRLMRIQRYLRPHFFGWARSWIEAAKRSMGTRAGSTSTSAAISTDTQQSSATSARPTERLNIVQTDLCYLKSLYTSSSDWYEMMTKSWFHEHKFHHFPQEREMLSKFWRGAGQSGHQATLAACDLITKMYFYNLINFDSCYVKYFQQTDVLGVERPGDNQETMATGSARQALGNSTSSSDLDQGHNQKEESASVDCCAARRKWPSGESSRREIFVAKPLHRMDLTEMGWLLVALTLLYGLSVLTLAWQALFSFLNETNLKTFSDISPSRMLIELRLFASSFALTRWLLINVLHVIIILNIFDLYKFFACCLICLSRARHLMLRLAQMSDYCEATSHLLEQEQRLLDRMAPKRERAHNYRLADEFAGPNTARQPVRSAGQRVRGQHSGGKHLAPASISAVRDLNTELKFVMTLIVIVQQELHDLKRFFSLYLNLELTFKSLCITLSICALLDSSNLFESCYLLTIFNTCTMPIFITMTTAALIENIFKGVCRNLNRVIITGGPIMSVSNLRQVIQMAGFLSNKSNRSFVVAGNFSLSLRSLVPILGWVATGVVMIRRDHAQAAGNA